MSEYSSATPIVSFENPTTGSAIDVVSMVHVGLPRYYRQIGSYIMGRQEEGSIVHYEGISYTEEPPRPTGPLERIKRRLQEVQLNHDDAGFATLLEHSSYTIQGLDELFHEEGSENHDIADHEYARGNSFLRNFGAALSSVRRAHKLEKAAGKGPDAIDELAFKIIKKCVDHASSGKARNSRRDKVTIDLRNQIALEAVDAALEMDPESKLVLVWGIGHLAGLRSGLIERGYDESGTTQEVEVAFNTPGIQRSIKHDQKKLERMQARSARRDAVTTYITNLKDKALGRKQPAIPSWQRNLPISYRQRNPGALSDFEKDRIKRQRETQKWLEESSREREKILQEMRRDRERLQREILGYPYPGKEKKRSKQFLSWFNAR